MEPQQQDTQNNRIGVLALVGLILALPLVLAYLFAAWSVALAAWNLMMSQMG